MVNSHCYVFGCNTGYRTCVDKIPLFSAPKNMSVFLQWKIAISRKCREFTKSSKVCAKHFTDESIIKGSDIKGCNGQVFIPLKR